MDTAQMGDRLPRLQPSQAPNLALLTLSSSTPRCMEGYIIDEETENKAASRHLLMVET